jgi:hypothetical protein
MWTAITSQKPRLVWAKIDVKMAMLAELYAAEGPTGEGAGRSPAADGLARRKSGGKRTMRRCCSPVPWSAGGYANNTRDDCYIVL